MKKNRSNEIIYNIKKSERIATACLMIIYVVIHVLLATHHEFWLDEAQAWCLVRDNSVLGILNQLKVEGHPVLWFTVLYPFAKLGCPIQVISVISIVCMGLAAYLLLSKAPFWYWLRVVILVSSIMLYYNITVCRIYSLVVVLLFSIAVCYKDRMEKPWRYCILLTLLLQSHIIMAGFGITLTLFFWQELLQRKEYRKQKRFYFSGLLPILSICFLYIELMGNKGEISYSGILKNIVNVPLASMNTFFCEFSFELGWSIGHLFPGWLFYAFLLAAIFLALLSWKKYWRQVLIVVCGLGCQVFIGAFIHKIIIQRAVLLFTTMVFSYWICWSRKEELKEQHREQQIEKIFEVRECFCKVLGGLLTAGIVIGAWVSVPFALRMMYDDYQRDYSGAERVAEYIENNLPKDAVIVTNQSRKTPAISGYDKDVRLWDPVSERFYTYIDWNEMIEATPSCQEVKNKVIKDFGTTDQIYFLLCKYNIPDDVNTVGMKLLFDEKPSIVEGEYFALYMYE